MKQMEVGTEGGDAKLKGAAPPPPPPPLPLPNFWAKTKPVASTEEDYKLFEEALKEDQESKEDGAAAAAATPPPTPAKHTRLAKSYVSE
ncbi:hypothetical protein C3L33_17823, partial [Rhododendron williamsianum]